MSNNRLYIGNRETGEAFCIAKDNSGDGWQPITSDLIDSINKIIAPDSPWDEKTSLVFFTESDSDVYFEFFPVVDSKTLDKCTCNENHDPHECPAQAEIDPDNTKMCTCCPYCTNECRMDI